MTHLASRTLDDDLDRVERVALRVHLMYCVPCRRFARQIQTISQALRRVAGDLASAEATPVPGPTLPDHIRDRIKQRLQQEE